MVKKVLLLSFILIGFVFAQMPRKCFADASAQLEQASLNIFFLIKKSQDYAGAQAAIGNLIADFAGDPNLPKALRRIAAKYEKKKKYEQAKSVFKKVATDFADTKDASRAQLGAAKVDVLSLIASGEDSDAQAKLDILIADFNDHSDLPEVLYDIAKRYERQGKYEQASSFYQQIIQQHPDSPEAAKAQFDIPKTDILPLIDSEDDPNAQAAIESLITDFNDYQRLPKVLHKFAQKYRKANKYEQAGDIYQQVAQHHPDSNGVTKAHLDASMMDILSFMEWGDDPNAQAAIESLITDFNGDPYLPTVISHIEQGYYKRIWAAEPPLSEDYFRNPIKVWEKVTAEFPDFFHDDPDLYYFIGDCYRQLGEYEKAIEYYSIVVDNWTRGQGVVLSRVSMPESDDMLGNDEAVLAMIDTLIVDFNDQPGLPGLILRTGEGYYGKAFRMAKEGRNEEAKEYYRKAITLWERMIHGLPPSAFSATACYLSAVSYRSLAEYEKAIECYEKVVSDWPDYEYGRQAQFMIGNCYERLIDSGSLPASEANPKIEQAYIAVVENYPDCRSSNYCALKLGWMNLNRGQWVDAAWYFEFLLQKAPENQQRSHILYHLGQAYEKMGQLDSAIDVYGEFMMTADPNDPRIKTVTARLEELTGAQN